MHLTIVFNQDIISEYYNFGNPRKIQQQSKTKAISKICTFFAPSPYDLCSTVMPENFSLLYFSNINKLTTK
jgi:hypothetical protein